MALTSPTAKVTDKAEIAPLLAKGVSSPVRWQQSVEAMIADGADTFVEIGPGKTLTGFLKKIDRSVKALHVEKAEDLIPILEDAFRQKIPCIIDCPVDYSENTKLSEYLQEKFE